MFHSVLRLVNAVWVNKLLAFNSSLNAPQSMEFLLLRAASAPPVLKMAPKVALAILEELTTLLSHPCPSMLHLAIAPLLLMEHSKELATAVSLMLNTCRQDRFALLAVTHPAAFAIEPSMVL